jgi:ABC-type tungstate transport system permease subunit
MGIDGKTTLSTLSAEGKDLMAEIWSSAAKDAKEAAESAYENWVNAFEQIADARAKLLSGENLIEDIAGNPELLAQYAKNAGIDPKELSKMIMSGSVTADTFDLSKSKTEYIDAEKTKYGLDLVSTRGHEFGT